MPNRFDVIPREYWQINTIGPAPASLSIDLAALETKVANLSTAPSSAASGDVTIVQRSDGSWPATSNPAGVHQRWLVAYDESKLPTASNGVRTGDEIITAAGVAVVK